MCGIEHQRGEKKVLYADPLTTRQAGYGAVRCRGCRIETGRQVPIAQPRDVIHLSEEVLPATVRKSVLE